MARGVVFNAHLDNWAVYFQRGFIRGRNMLLNVEKYAMMYSGDPEKKACIVLLDYSRAFPSINRNFIWLALKAVGIPSSIINALNALYARNFHFVRTSTGLQFVFQANSGVRQGCPLSSIILVLVTDCLNRMVSSFIGNFGIIRSYADDGAIVLS